MVSMTVSVWLVLLVLPHASVNVQVRVMISGSDAQPAPELESTPVTVMSESQLSVAVRSPASGTSPAHSKLASAGATGGTGGVVSLTVMICAELDTLPQASVAVHVRVMVDSCGQLPDAVLSLWVTTGAGSQLSSAVATPVADGSVSPPHSTVVFGGNDRTGPTESSTVMI